MVSKSTTEHTAPRRQWPLAEKRRIVELTLGAGRSMQAIATEYGLHVTSLSHWKRLYRAGKLDAAPVKRVRRGAESVTFVPVTITPAARASHAPTSHQEWARRDYAVHVLFESGATLRLDLDRIDADLVCALVAELRR